MRHQCWLAYPEELEEGMVFALEPKIVLLPGVGPVGIENSWVVTENGAGKLTILVMRRL